MDPKVWGPKTWFYLHSLPENVTPAAQIGPCINNLVLPCATCQKSLNAYRQKNSPLAIRSRDDAHRYINSLHNSVNERLGKPTVSFDDCKKKWCSPPGVTVSHKGSRILSLAF